jgi:hypothetical protein
MGLDHMLIVPELATTYPRVVALLSDYWRECSRAISHLKAKIVVAKIFFEERQVYSYDCKKMV